MSKEIYEIERKFLVKEIPNNLQQYKCYKIKQGYISTNPTIRLRQRDNEYILTIKSSGIMKKLEYELPITEEQFNNLWHKVEGNAIEKNRDLNYKVNIDYTKTINEQELLRETRVILSLIYRDYLCTDEQRKEIILNDKKELNEKYEINFEEIKNKRKKTYDTTEIEDKQLVKIEEKWYKRIFNKILSIFKSN